MFGQLDIFQAGEVYPSPLHEARIKRYKDNKQMFKGEHFDVLKKVYPELNDRYRNTIYVALNLPSVIAKKSADFLFGESAVVSAGKEDNSPEQKAVERFITDNDLNILNYESALSNAYRGDAFYKVRYGQEYGGYLPKEVDAFRVVIENQNPEYVFPETIQGDANKVICYHIAYPVLLDENRDEWILKVESHFAGAVRYREFVITPLVQNAIGEVLQWTIDSDVPEADKTIKTGVPYPLVVHIPNFATDDNWEGMDDIYEHYGLIMEISNRLSLIADILDKHSNPAMAVPMGTLEEDANGVPQFRVGIDKVFEIMDKQEIVPQYITWNGELTSAFQQLDKLIELFFTLTEVPMVSLGAGDSGTSGSSGLSIKFRMSSMISKVNRKRQYYDKALKRVFKIAQLLEKQVYGDALEYEVTDVKIHFKDGLPDDEMEQATIYSTRLAGMPTISQKTAIMKMDGLTEEQADMELERMKKEQDAQQGTVDASVFNKATPQVGGAN